MKILFVGVFTKGSTNNSQRDCLIRLGHDVEEFHYRSINNSNETSNELFMNIELQEKSGYDIILIAKGNGINKFTMNELKQNNKKIVYWFPDPAKTFTMEMAEKTMLSDVAFFDKKNSLEKAMLVNKQCRYICEGYDESVDFLQDVKKEYDISFIGNMYGNRSAVLERLNNVKIISSAYGLQHSIEVGKSKINLNICTDNCASDRVYKILAAGGFLLTDDWYGRELTGLVDGEDLIIYNDIKDLEEKINKYLPDEEERNRISKNGMAKVKKLTRTQWAKEISK